jgi:serine protease Do
MSLDELESVSAAVAARVAGAVVGIGRGWGMGTGVVVAPGQVLTNAHNLFSGPGGDVAVTFADGRVAAAESFTADVDGELAVLRVDTGGATPPEWAESTPSAGAVVDRKSVV